MEVDHSPIVFLLPDLRLYAGNAMRGSILPADALRVIPEGDNSIVLAFIGHIYLLRYQYDGCIGFLNASDQEVSVNRCVAMIHVANGYQRAVLCLRPQRFKLFFVLTVDRLAIRMSKSA